MRIEYRLLSEVQVTVDGRPVDLGHARQRCVLAALAAEANQPMTAERLGQRLWGSRPPESGRATIRNYVARLRKVVPTGDGYGITRRSGGYVLVADAHLVDLLRFRDLCRRARSAEDDSAAATLFDEALALFHGEPLAGIASPWAAELREQLRAERSAAQFDLDDVRLRHGSPPGMAADLTARLALRPHDERLAGQLMLALYREGRQADALQTYQRTRTRLVEDLGLEPNPALRTLHRRILVSDRALDLPVPEPISVPAAVVTSRLTPLPAEVGDFTGRRREIDELMKRCTEPGSIVCVDGMAGIGKTALAVHVGHLLSPHYPDGQIFLNLHGYSPRAEPVEPHAALGTALTSLGVPREVIPASTEDRAAMWRRLTSTCRLLVVLDNALDGEQILPLLPAGRAGCTLVTSRYRLAAPDGAHGLSLSALDHDDAFQLFSGIVGDGRPATEPHATRQLLQRCGHLPLAIRLAATRLRHRRSWRVADLADRLDTHREPLREFALGDRDIQAVFAASYDQLSEHQRRIFATLGLVPGTDFDAFLVGEMIATEPDGVAPALEHLVDVHLLQTAQAGRFHFHDLLRSYAELKAQSDLDAAERDAVTDRILDYYLRTCDQAIDHVDALRDKPAEPPETSPGAAPRITSKALALAWLDTERPNLPAVVRFAVQRRRLGQAWRLAHTLWHYYWNRGHTDDWITTSGSGLSAARKLRDPDAEALIRDSLGLAHRTAGNNTEARAHFQAALTLRRQRGDRCGQGRALRYLGSISQRLGDYGQALEHFTEAICLLTEVGADRELMHTYNSRAIAQYRRGEFADAGVSFHRALALARRLGDRPSEASYLANLAGMEIEAGDGPAAVRHLERAIRIKRSEGDPRTAIPYNNLAVALGQLGEVDKALHYHHLAVHSAISLQNRALEAVARHDFGNTLHAIGRDQEALIQHQTALALATQAGDTYLRARIRGCGGCRDPDHAASVPSERT